MTPTDPYPAKAIEAASEITQEQRRAIAETMAEAAWNGANEITMAVWPRETWAELRETDRLGEVLAMEFALDALLALGWRPAI